MKLEWNINEIKQRIKEVIDLLKIRKLDNKYLKLYDELIELCSMTYFFNGSDVDDSFLSKNQENFIIDYYNNQVINALKIFEDNLFMHTNISQKIITIFNKINFHRYEGELENVSTRLSINLIRDFLEQYDLNQLHYFNELIFKKHINITNRKLNFYEGITYFTADKPFILCGRTNNINLGVVLIHEFGHAYSIKKNNLQHLQRNKNLSEINSHYMEYVFLKFLIENNLFADDALLIQNNNYFELYILCLKLLILTSIKNLKCNESYDITNSQKEIRKSILSIELVRNDELLRMDKDLNLHSILKYTYGNLMGLVYSNKYISNPINTKKEVEEIMMGKKELRDIITLKGVEKELSLNNKKME